MKKTVNLLNPGRKNYSLLNYARFVSFVTSVTLATVYVVYVASGANTTIGNNISTSGTLTVGNTALFSGALKASSTLQATGKTTLFGDLEVGTGYLFVSSSTGAIGLGTTSPNAHLHLAGGGDEFVLFEYEDGTSTSGLRFKNESTGLERAALKWNENNNRWDFYVGSSGNTNDIKFQITNTGITASGTLSVLSTSASSTFANGINLTKGCFAVNGTCVTSGGGSGTVNAGTQGQVAFYNANGTAVNGTSTLFINTARQVGINATNTADIIAPFVVVDDGVNGTALFKDAHVGISQGTILLDTVLYVEPDAGDVNSLFVADTAGSGKFVITKAGLVGVATETPSTAFSVGGDTLVKGTLTIDSGGGEVAADIQLGNGANIFAKNSADDQVALLGTVGDFSFLQSMGSGIDFYNSSSQTLVRIQNGGNVGVGTTSPSQKLSVQGGALISGTTTLSGLHATGTALLATAGGNVGIGTANPTNTLSVSGNANVTGNVGFGASPGSNRLNISGATDWTDTISGGTGIMGRGPSMGTIGGQSVTPIGYYATRGSAEGYAIGIEGSSGRKLVFGWTGTPGTGGHIIGAPNLVLGSDSDSGLLQLVGTKVGVGTQNPYSRFQISSSGTGTGQAFAIVDSASTTLVQVLDNGKVGIGTTSPSQALSVHGNSLFSGNLSLANLTATGTLTVQGIGTSTFANGIQLSAGCFRDGSGSCVGGGGGSGTVGTATLAGQVPYYASASDTLTATSTLFISTASRVGVGTTSPQQALHLTKGSLLQTIETNPAVVGSITDATLLDGAFSVFVSGKFAFVAALNSNRLTIVDVSSTTPVIVSSLNDATNFNGISSVYVSGKYAYVTALTGGRFTVVDITNINTPRVVGSIADATKLAGAQGLYVSGKYAYVTGTTNGYLNIIDISNPTSPTIAGFINNTTQIGQARNVYVSGRYAYIAVENNSRLTIVDISNSTSPTIVASLNDGTNLNGASAVYVSGKYAYVGLNVGTRFTIVDVSNPASPTVVSSLNNSNFNGTKAVQVSGRYAYVSNFGSNLTIVDVFNPNNPVIVGSVTDSTNLNGVRGAHVVGKYAYMVASTGDSLAIVDLPGSEFASANIGLINSNQISVSENIYADNNLHVGNGLNVGSGGIFSRGPLSVYLSSTTQTSAISGFFEGRVGIGTTSPSQALSVQGSALISSNVTMSGGQLRIPGGTVTAPGIIIGDPVSGSNQTGIFNPGGTLSFVDDNAIFKWRAAGSGFNNGMMELTAQVSGCPGTGACIHLGNVSGSGTTEVDKVGIYWAAANTLGFLSNSLERGRIDSSGNWGIGTTSPTQKLSVHGNALFSGNLSLANLTATGTLTVQGTGTSTFANGLDISSGCFAINGTCVGGGGGGSGTVNNGTQGQVAFYDATGTAVSGTSTIFITSAQNVGIGTTSPAEKLAIAGRLYVGGSGTSTVENNLKVLGNLQIGAGTLTLSGDSITSTNSIRFGGGINANSAPVSSSTSQIITSVVTSGYGSGGNDLHDIAIGIDGLPLIAEQESGSLKVIHCGNSTCTSGNTKTTVDSSAADIGRFPSIAIGTDGLPIISYYDFTNGDLEVVKCGNISCSSGNVITTVEPTGDSGRGTSIAIGADGLPIISFGYFTDFNLKVVKCGNAACSSGNTISLVDGVSGSVGLENSIAIGTDGLPIISYYAVTGDDLKVAKCNNASCSSSALTTVDTGSGRYNRIAIAGDGLPVISYSVGSTLRMTKCGNISCSSGNTTTDVDTTAASGARTFIAVGTDGLPVIAYQDTANDFSVAKCNNATCSSNTQTIIEAGDSSLLGQFPKIAIGVDNLPTIAYGGNSGGVLRVVTCANTSCSSTSGTAFTGGQTLGGWISTPRSYSPPFQAVNTVKIINPTAFQNLSFLSGGAERLTITPVGRVGVGSTSPMSALSIHTPAVSSLANSTTTTSAINLVQDVTGEDPVWAQFGLNGIDADGTQMSAWIGTQITDGFSIMTASRERMRISSNGNVGIGTSSPMSKLSVVGNIAVTGCVKGAETGDNLTPEQVCADLAESYPAGEALEPGDIVALASGSASFRLMKATKEGMPLIGAISSNPAVLFEGSIASFGAPQVKDFYEAGEKAPLALAGRIPVKVNLEGGPIQIGDPITLSSVPGVGRKATESGRIVGYALENYDGPTSENGGKLLVFASLENYKTSSSNQLNGVLAQVVDIIRGWLESMKIFVQDGLLKVKNLVAETFQIGSSDKPQGITIFDVDTGEPYCVVMKSGALVTAPGECAYVTNNQQQTTNDDTEGQETNSADLNGPSQAPPPPPSMQSDNTQDEASTDQEQEESSAEDAELTPDDSFDDESEDTAGTTTPEQ